MCHPVAWQQMGPPARGEELAKHVDVVEVYGECKWWAEEVTRMGAPTHATGWNYSRGPMHGSVDQQKLYVLLRSAFCFVHCCSRPCRNRIRSGR